MWAHGPAPSRIRTSTGHAHPSPRSPGRYRLPLANIDEGGFWDSIPSASLLAIFRCLDSKDVAAACCVCSHWKDVGSSKGLWRELLVREFRVPLTGVAVHPGVDCRQMLIDAKTSRLWAWGDNALKLAGVSAPKFIYPTEVYVHAIEGRDDISGAALSAEHRDLRHLPARSVACGEDFTVILTWEGQVVDSRACLTNNAPHRHGGRTLAPLRKWPFPAHPVIAVAAGGAWSGLGKTGGHAAAVAADGALWVWGGNGCGQLGLGSRQEFVDTPRIPPTLGPVQGRCAPVHAVDCGERHTAVLLTSGAVYTAGSNEYGACGIADDFAEVPIFRQAEGLDGMRCKVIACGDHNTAVLTEAGEVMVAGDNSHGQCGLPFGEPPRCATFKAVGPNLDWSAGAPRKPRYAQGPADKQQQQQQQQQQSALTVLAAHHEDILVVDVACGNATVYARTSQGDCFAWGSGGQGQLGVGGSTKANAKPQRLPCAHQVLQVTGAAGGNFGAAVDIQGRVLTFGAGRSGQLGHGDLNKRLVPRVVKPLLHTAGRRVAIGAEFTMAITSWKPPAPMPPPSPSPVPQFEGLGTSISRPSRPIARSISSVAFSGRDTVFASGKKFNEMGLPSELPPPRGFPGPRLSLGADKKVNPRRIQRKVSFASSWTSEMSDGTLEASALESAMEMDSDKEEVSSEPEETPGPSFSAHQLEAGAGRPDTSLGHPPKPPPLPKKKPRRLTRPKSFPGAIGNARWAGASPPGGDSTEEEEDDAAGKRLAVAFHRLLRRQLEDFAADKSQRELVFPAALSATDRRQIHAACEAWGLMHQSRGDEPERQLVVWKPGSHPSTPLAVRHGPVPLTPFDDGPLPHDLTPLGPSHDSSNVVSPTAADDGTGVSSPGGALFSMDGLRSSVMACRADSQPLPEDIQAHGRAHMLNKVLEELAHKNAAHG